MVQSDWLLRGPLFHLETSAEVFYRGPLFMYLPMEIYVEVTVTMMQCIIKKNCLVVPSLRSGSHNPIKTLDSVYNYYL